MSTTKAGEHTPGPWEIGSSYEEPKGMAPFISVHGDVGIAYVFGDSRKEREANARLIAAAPALLEACKLALMTGAEDFKTAEKRRSICRAAIRAAEEKAQT